jgi:hypothetical protein
MTFRRSVILVMELVAISVAVWGIGKTYVKLSQSDTPVLLITTPASGYSVGTPVPITATLGLPASTLFPTTLKVCTLSLTTLRVKKVLRNGVAVKPIHGVSDFVADPRLLEDSYISTIASGDTVEIPLTTRSDRNGHPFLKDVRMNGEY